MRCVYREWNREMIQCMSVCERQHRARGLEETRRDDGGWRWIVHLWTECERIGLCY